MKAFIRMPDGPVRIVECENLEVRSGVTYIMEGYEDKMLLVIADKILYHPVVDLEVM